MSYQTLGDPHLGRKFRTGVPVHRLGDREEMVWKQFTDDLMNTREPYHICVGDLFDKFVVPPEVLLRAAEIYRDAVRTNPGTTYVVIQGNHDVSRDSKLRSSFDVFAQLVPEVLVVQTPTLLEELNAWAIPYNPFEPVADTLAELPLEEGQTLFMHHDFTDFGGEQVIPTERMQGLTVVNGHDHLARTEVRHGVTVEMTGSMQPYTHAEDADGDLYITCRLDEIPDDCRDVNVRVLLEEGEVLPDDLDCLSLIGKRAVKQDEDEVAVDTSEFDNFDLRTALGDVLHPLVKDELMEKFNA